MQKWQLNLIIAALSVLGFQLVSEDVDRYFYSTPVEAPSKEVSNQVQVVSKNATIIGGSDMAKPQTGEAPASTASEKPETVEYGGKFTLSELNAMDAKGLEQLNGVGPVLAQRILEYRQANGPFESVDELNQVKGIGPKKLEKIQIQFK